MRPSLLLALAGFALFAAIAAWRAQQPVVLTPQFFTDRVVIPAPLLVALHGGDRFLAADLETLRLAATGMDDRGVDTGYLVRAQREVARLNACHEDNYYLANGLLTWGGAVEQGNEVLRAAVECRFWDEFPPFFYGINLSFFQRNNEEAARVLEIGAQRSTDNAAAMQKLAVMLRAEQFADERLALNFQQLVDRGLLDELPTDPLRLGYELRDGSIELKKLKIAGLEEQP